MDIQMGRKQQVCICMATCETKNSTLEEIDLWPKLTEQFLSAWPHLETNRLPQSH